MSLDIGKALRQGASRTLTTNGAMLMVAFLGVGVVNLVVVQSLQLGLLEWAAQVNPEAATDRPPLPLAAPIPPALAAVGALLIALLAETVRVVAVRTMASDHTRTVPARLVARNLPLAVLNGFVGGIVVGVLVLVGGLLLVLPGIFLALSFFFVRQEIAVEDENFVEAMVNSWELGTGNRVELFALALSVFAVALVAFVPYFVLFVALDPGSAVPQLAQVTLSAPVTVFGVATATRAYVQLKTADATEGADGGDGEEWPDPPGVDI